MKPFAFRLSPFAFAAALLAAATGCTHTAYVDPKTGAKFSRTSVGTTQSIGAIRVTSGADGVRSLTVEGYTNEQAQIAGAVVEAAIKARLP